MIKKNRYLLYFILITIGLLACINKATSVKFGLSLNTSRYYMNEDTMASFLGALLKCGYEDIVFNGFSTEIGESTGGSSTHKSGYNGDLRYLCKNKPGNPLRLDYNEKADGIEPWTELDEVRQEKLNDALYSFGWKSMISQKYGEVGKKRLLKRCTEDTDKYNHYNHLHLQGYKNNFIKTIKSYE